MRGLLKALVVVLSLIGLFVAPVASTTLANPGDTGPCLEREAPHNESPPSGTNLSRAVVVTGVEISGEIDQRTFANRFQNGRSQQAKAAVLANQLSSLETRLEELEQQRAELEEAQENGEISDDEYHIAVVEISARSMVLEGLANSVQQSAQSLPPHLLEEHDVDTQSIQELRNRAGNVTGPEVAPIALGITNHGPGGPAPNATHNAGREVGTTGSRGAGTETERQPSNDTRAQSGDNDQHDINTTEEDGLLDEVTARNGCKPSGTAG